MGEKNGVADLHLINAQLMPAGHVVNSTKRSRLRTCTHLHQATTFVTTADLCLGHVDILRIFIYTFESVSRLDRSLPWPRHELTALRFEPAWTMTASALLSFRKTVIHSLINGPAFLRIVSFLGRVRSSNEAGSNSSRNAVASSCA